MSEKLDGAIALVKAELAAEIADIRADAGEAEADLISDLEAAELSTNEALAAGDFDHVAKIVTDHLPALANREWLEMRQERKAAWQRRIQNIVSGLLRIGLGAVAMLALLILPGCAALKTGSVTTPALRGEIANVCGAAAECAAAGYIAALPKPCDEADPTSLISRMRTSSVVDGRAMLVDLGKVCGPIDACVEAWDDLPSYKARDWPEWCETLEENARAAG